MISIFDLFDLIRPFFDLFFAITDFFEKHTFLYDGILLFLFASLALIRYLDHKKSQDALREQIHQEAVKYLKELRKTVKKYENQENFKD